jgi:predicted  nucleic acid-binding Zn-ribbon protein
MSGRRGFLSDVIVELGFATRETVEQAVRAARSPGTTVARVLVDMNSISEEQLARATAERYGIDYIDLEGFAVDRSAADLIEPAAAQRYQAVPVGFLGEVLLVAMADPADALGLSEIAALTGREVRPAVASRPALDALLEALPLGVAAVERPRDPEATGAPAAATGGESPLRAELGALKQQLADAESQLQAPGAGAGGPYVAALEAKLAEAEAELEAARSRVREAKEVSAELETLREALAAAEAGLRARAGESDSQPRDVRELRARLASAEAERDAARTQTREVETQLGRIRADVTARSGELDSLRARLSEAETELVRLRAGSEGAEEPMRADEARRALAELREESERERERWAVAERDLLDMLDEETARRAELEERLSEVEGSAFAAERAFEELRLAQGRMRGALRALAEPEATES